jgi:hypothetical protein
LGPILKCGRVWKQIWHTVNFNGLREAAWEAMFKDCRPTKNIQLPRAEEGTHRAPFLRSHPSADGRMLEAGASHASSPKTKKRYGNLDPNRKHTNIRHWETQTSSRGTSPSSTLKQGPCLQIHSCSHVYGNSTNKCLPNCLSNSVEMQNESQ